MDIVLGIGRNKVVDVRFGILREPNQRPPFVLLLVQRPGIKIPITRVGPGLIRLLAPDHPHSILTIDGELRHPEISTWFRKRHIRASRPTAIGKSLMETNLVVGIVVS